ncbi:STAS/SEC14 domain-containing protein [Sphingobium sp. EM0848]|uniref:STAS/SEC14 domain-containing protein n=1 Tax=Sphingobium sp. EM0848 TaxID=2743473 RepID=UPI00159C7F12|nr:STAS/SEC14 domain-containing protein [Sphingobium sp. EM0848]
MYVIDFRHDLNLLDIRWKGIFTDEIIADYARLLKRQFIEQGFQPGYLLRMDMTDSAVQTQDAVGAFGRNLGDFPKARRIAIVTPSVIARMQVRRVMTQPYLRIFSLAEPALEWLLAEAVEPAGGR